MRRFSSEGSLLDLDILPWRRLQVTEPALRKRESGARNTQHPSRSERDARCATLPPNIREPGSGPGGADTSAMLTKELSVSVEDLTALSKHQMDYLGVGTMGDGFRAYSDGQLAPTAQGSSTESSLHSSNSNLSQADQKDSAKERRSRLRFMRQWSEMGHSKGTRFTREELERWAQSLNNLLSSREGVSVFGAFLRSEFSEENLQFYQACQQYQLSSHNFSLQRRAKDICTTYIQPGSTREVNLDSKTRELTIQLLQAPSHNSLYHAQKRIYALLDADCYPRFLQSSIYLSLLEDSH
ncbi:hypothetical protein CRUP_028064 [Coryphaenoides rupestris]|nr:hypothetical protein CRUP_028064 [Coryphaenoides rupestris]